MSHIKRSTRLTEFRYFIDLSIFFLTGAAFLSSVGIILYSTLWYGPRTQALVDDGVTWHLEQAAQASTVKIAKEEITSAIRFAQTNTKLQTRLKRHPDLNQEFQAFVRNLKGMQQNLERDGNDNSRFSQKVALKQLRTDLIDENNIWKGMIKVPDFYIYALRDGMPYLLLSLLVLCIGCCYLTWAWREE